ncbi:MAG: polysaccharide deacetylase [Ruminococcaceae bacterium]|nr:polysaccharide deacetylase [Oscillospiraceae bacterium]
MRYQFLRFPGGKAKALTFSYDDGCSEDLRFADTLTKYGLKGTFNLNSVEMKKELSVEDIEEHILSKGHEVAVHGYFHRANGTLRSIEGIQDVLNCRLELEKTFGRIIRGMAYPDTGITRFHNGSSYEKAKQYLTELDIAYVRTLGGDNNSFTLPTDWHAWMPTAHHNNPNILEYLDEFVNMDMSTNVYAPMRYPRLFYIWGHSFEFPIRNNWEHLDAICEKVANNNEIWFATNIEIYDYVKAYESLIYSANGKIIYNPTLITVWFDIDGKLYMIKPGETLKV